MDMVVIISSQRYIDQAIVDEKLSMRDFGVLLSPVFKVEGVEYQVVLDGHHSLEAARQAGVRPIFGIGTAQDSDRLLLLMAGRVDEFLVASQIDCDYYDIATGCNVW